MKPAPGSNVLSRTRALRSALSDELQLVQPGLSRLDPGLGWQVAAQYPQLLRHIEVTRNDGARLDGARFLLPPRRGTSGRAVPVDLDGHELRQSTGGPRFGPDLGILSSYSCRSYLHRADVQSGTLNVEWTDVDTSGLQLTLTGKRAQIRPLHVSRAIGFPPLPSDLSARLQLAEDAAQTVSEKLSGAPHWVQDHWQRAVSGAPGLWTEGRLRSVLLHMQHPLRRHWLRELISAQVCEHRDETERQLSTMAFRWICPEDDQQRRPALHCLIEARLAAHAGVKLSQLLTETLILTHDAHTLTRMLLENHSRELLRHIKKTPSDGER